VEVFVSVLREEEKQNEGNTEKIADKKRLRVIMDSDSANPEIETKDDKFYS